MNISRASSVEARDTFIFSISSDSDTESDARTPQENNLPENATVQGHQITQQQWQSNSIKAKLLKLFCCR